LIRQVLGVFGLMPYEKAKVKEEERGNYKSRNAFRTISEVSKELDVLQHVLRFWESKFSQIKPMKRAGNRRYYRPEDVEVLKFISHKLYSDGYTIKGVQKLIKDHGIKVVIDAWKPDGTDNILNQDPLKHSVNKNVDVTASDRGTIQEVLLELKSLRASLD
jgi:DNA-binding transcriptional MerR regulator